MLSKECDDIFCIIYNCRKNQVESLNFLIALKERNIQWLQSVIELRVQRKENSSLSREKMTAIVKQKKAGKGSNIVQERMEEEKAAVRNGKNDI